MNCIDLGYNSGDNAIQQQSGLHQTLWEAQNCIC